MFEAFRKAIPCSIVAAIVATSTPLSVYAQDCATPYIISSSEPLENGDSDLQDVINDGINRCSAFTVSFSDTLAGETISLGNQVFILPQGVTLTLTGPVSEAVTLIAGASGNHSEIFNINGGSLHLENVRLNGNQSNRAHALVAEDSTVRLSGTVIEGFNDTAIRATNSRIHLSTSRFINNLSTSGSIVLESPLATNIDNCLFYGNVSPSGTAVLRVNAAANPVNLLHSTFIDNHSAQDHAAGAISISTNSEINITNTLFSGNSGAARNLCITHAFDDFFINLRNSFIDISDNNETLCTFQYLDDGSNRIGREALPFDPQLEEIINTEGNVIAFGPSSHESPLVDSGYSTQESHIQRDITGHTRLSRSEVDIGAVEYRNRAPVITSELPSILQGDSTISLPLNTMYSDPESDLMTFTANQLPEGLTLSETGLLEGTLTNASELKLELTVSDNYGAETNATFHFVMYDYTSNLTASPGIIFIPSPDNVSIDLSEVLNNTQSTDATLRLVGVPAGLTIDTEFVLSGSIAPITQGDTTSIIEISPTATIVSPVGSLPDWSTSPTATASPQPLPEPTLESTPEISAPSVSEPKSREKSGGGGTTSVLLFVILALLGFFKISGYGRKADHSAPPAQIRTYATNVYGSYLEYLASNRFSGYSCTILTLGRYRLTQRPNTAQVILLR